MEKEQILTRIQSKTDQRKVLITLTEKGKEMQVAAAEIPSNLLNRLNINMDQAQLDEALKLKNSLYNLISTLENMDANNKTI